MTTITTSALLLSMLFAQVAASGDDHGAEAASYEWGGTFDTPDSKYAWTMQIVDGDWADPAMKLAVFSTSDSSTITDAQKSMAQVSNPSVFHCASKPLSQAPPARKRSRARRRKCWRATARSTP